MELREFAFRQAKPVERRKTITLKCSGCGEVVTRPKFAPYTGHIYEQSVTYICDICRSDMVEVPDVPRP